jgi:hypothetical protein
MFTRNTLCGIAAPRVGLTTANFLDRLLDPAVKLGTSTPKADPSGDYTWTMFRRADAVRPGSHEIPSAKAQQIVGGPSSNAPADGKDPVVAALAAGRVNVIIGYCIGANPDISPVGVIATGMAISGWRGEVRVIFPGVRFHGLFFCESAAPFDAGRLRRRAWRHFGTADRFALSR